MIQAEFTATTGSVDCPNPSGSLCGLPTVPREFYDFEDFHSGRWDDFDLFVPGYSEILSGARRESDYEKILTKLERDGVSKQTPEVLLKLAKEGRLKPSAGAGIGLERLIGWVLAQRRRRRPALSEGVPEWSTNYRRDGQSPAPSS